MSVYDRINQIDENINRSKKMVRICAAAAIAAIIACVWTFYSTWYNHPNLSVLVKMFLSTTTVAAFAVMLWPNVSRIVFERKRVIRWYGELASIILLTPISKANVCHIDKVVDLPDGLWLAVPNDVKEDEMAILSLALKTRLKEMVRSNTPFAGNRSLPIETSFNTNINMAERDMAAQHGAITMRNERVWGLQVRMSHPLFSRNNVTMITDVVTVINVLETLEKILPASKELEGVEQESFVEAAVLRVLRELYLSGIVQDSHVQAMPGRIEVFVRTVTGTRTMYVFEYDKVSEYLKQLKESF